MKSVVPKRQGPTLTTAIGQQFRVLRNRLSLRQEDVSGAARALGFRWSRVTVARLEAGLRPLEAGEFLMLPEMLMIASLRAQGNLGSPGIDGVLELGDLFPTSGMLALTRECQVDVRALRHMVEGHYGLIKFTDLDVPFQRAARIKQAALAAAVGRQLAQNQELREALDSVWAAASAAVKAKAVQEAEGGAEQKAGRNLGVHPAALALAAQRRWGQSLTAERDQRVAARSDREPPRRLQAIRGHVTRTLLEELGPLLAEHQRE